MGFGSGSGSLDRGWCSRFLPRLQSVVHTRSHEMSEVRPAAQAAHRFVAVGRDLWTRQADSSQRSNSSRVLPDVWLHERAHLLNPRNRSKAATCRRTSSGHSMVDRRQLLSPAGGNWLPGIRPGFLRKNCANGGSESKNRRRNGTTPCANGGMSLASIAGCLARVSSERARLAIALEEVLRGAFGLAHGRDYVAAVRQTVAGWLGHMRHADSWGLRRAVFREFALGRGSPERAKQSAPAEYDRGPAAPEIER